MSRFDVKPRSRSTLTSTHRPWQSNPFWYRSSSPSIAWKRWYRSLYARPQAWWTPIGLFAVIGPSRKLQRGPPAFCARSRANVRRSRHVASSSCSWATRSGFEVTGRNMHLRSARGIGGRPESRSATRPASPSILPAMQHPQEARPRARSPFTAAFLSLLFPGLGHLYAGAPMRALGFAAPPILLLALLGGVLIRLDRFELVGAFIQQVGAIFVFNLIALAYRLIAIVDAYRVAAFLNAHAVSGDGRLGRARLPANPLSIAGLIAVLLVMAGSHVVVARIDMLASDARACIFVNQSSADDCTDTGASPSPGATDSGDTSDEPTDSPTPEPTLIGTPVPSVDVPEWNGKDRLNILLIGADEQAGGHNTDTMITLSIDPVSKQVAMFSLPRDTQQVPVPPGPAQRVWGSTYGQKINSWFVNNRHRSDLWPGNDRTRGYNALKAIIGNLYNLDIKYFV